ncbi:MFS transporter [Pseudopelagicola sp. nBUS_20]|uniref:MFS transporter n=1 Tax=Pseudopelagicola sp. nBUS_20 TaxID=3395317 RepID=UPI003EB9DAA6
MKREQILDSRYSWLRLGVTLGIALVANVGMWAVIVVMPAIQAEFGIDRADASLPYTATMIGFAVGNFMIGRAVDRWGITISLVGAATLSALSFGLAAMSQTILTLSLIHFFLGFGTAVGFGPLIADISLWFQKRRGIAVAVAASGNYLSGAIWPIMLSGVLNNHGWRAVFVVLAALTLVVVLPMSLLLQRRVPLGAVAAQETDAMTRLGSAPFRPAVLQWLLGLAGICCCVAMSMPQVHIVSFCVDLGYGPSVGAEMLALMLMGGVVSRIISGLVADNLGGVVTLLIGAALQCLALFAFLPFEGLVPLYTVSLVFGLSQGGIVPAYALVVREYMPAREAGSRVGFVMMATILGMALGGWMSGWIYDLSGSYEWAFLNGIAWNFLNIAILSTLLIRVRGRRLPQPV